MGSRRGKDRRLWNRAGLGAGIALLAVAWTYATSQWPLVHLVHLKALDALFLFRGHRSPSDIVLLTVDQKSLDTFPELQVFWHRYYAEAIEASAAAGALVFGLDVAFGVPVERWEPGHDQALAAAVSEASSTMPVVCGFVAAAMAKQGEWPVPVNMVASALGLSAMANLTVDADDFVRRQELIEAPAADGRPLMRSFALRIAELYLGQEANLRDGGLYLGEDLIPVDDRRRLMINYRGPPATFPRISLSDFLAAARAGRQDQLRGWVEGRAVLLGPDSIGDRHATPFYTTFRGSQWNTAGVEIHANTLHTLLKRDYLVPVPETVRLLAIFLVAAVTTFIVLTQKPVMTTAWLLLNFAATAAVNYLLFVRGRVLSTSEMLVTGLFALLWALIYRFLAAEKRGRLFHRAVSIFVGRQVATALDSDEAIRLTGTRQTLTILFTDVRGFTSFCDSKDPAEVVGVLNEYLRQVVAIIVSHRGQVNKFLGDGILAVFSDDDGTEPGDHATRAVECARAIVGAPGPFRTGAGIHSGEAIVGNVGSQEKMEYTVLGDTVNLASRLESLNKDLRTQMIFSESTKAMLRNGHAIASLGRLPIRGKTEPIGIYTLAEFAPREQGTVDGAKES